MTTRFAVFGFSTRWQKDSVISAVKRRNGQIVYWNLRDPADIERCRAVFPDFESLAFTRAENFKSDRSLFLYEAARETAELATMLWPSFLKSAAMHDVDRSGLDAHAVFYTQIGIALSILERTKPDVLLFGNVPTGFVPYACYLIGRKRGLTVRILRRVLLPGINNLSLISDSIENAAPIEKLYRAAIESGAHTRAVELPNDMASHLATLRSATDTESASPDYFKEKVKFNKRDSGIRGPGLNFPRAFFYSIFRGQHRRSLGGFDTVLSLVRRHRLYRQYHALTTTPSLDVPYIYVPLHFQPEASTVPNGGVFAHQHFMVDLLSKTAPEGWRIYVKEHPSQLLYYYPNKLFRSRRYYAELADYPNVSLLPVSAPSNVSLIRNAKAVATVTGHSGWEAINWGIPALAFGFPWYGACDGVHRVYDAKSLQSAFTRVRDGGRPDPRKIALYLSLIRRHVIVGEYRAKADEIDAQAENHINRLAEAICNSMPEPATAVPQPLTG